MALKRSTQDQAELNRLKRARNFWGFLAFIGGLAAAVCLVWMTEIPYAGQIGIFLGFLASASGCALFSWYEIKVIRFRQFLALSD